MADYKVGVGVDVDFGELSKLKSEIKSLENKSIKVNVDLSDASIKNIQSIMGRAVDSKTANNMFAGVERAAAKSATSAAKTFTGVFGKANFKDIDKQISAIEKRKSEIGNLTPGKSTSFNTYKQMLNDLTQVSKLMRDVSKLDFNKNSQEISTITSRVETLVASYKNALGEIGANLKPTQVNALNEIIEKTGFELDRIKAKSKDAFNFNNAKAGLNQVKSDANELIRIINEKAKLNIDLSSLDKADEKAKTIEARLKALSDRENVLLNRSLGSFNDSQSERITQAQSKANSRVALAKAGNIDNAKLEQTKIEVSQIKDVINQIGNQRVKILGLDETSKDADEARAKLAALEAQLDEMVSKTSQRTDKKQDNQIATSYENMKRRVAEEKEKIARSISEDVGAKDYGTIARNYMREIDSLNNGSDNLKKKGKELQNLAVDISTANSMMEKSAKGSDKWNYAFERANAARKEFQKTEAFLKNDISDYSGLKKQAENADKAALAFDNLNLKKTNFYDSIDVWRKNHSAVIGTDFDTQLTNIQNRIQDIDSPGSLNNLKAEFAQVTNQAQLADKATLNVGDRIKNQLKQYATYFGVAGAMMVGSQGIRSMFNNTLQVDTQMTELRRVTDLSESQYTNLFSEMTASAQQYGVALSDIISATADWSRAGFDANTSKQLAEITTMYQHVSDLDYDEAAQNLLTSYKGFEKQLTERYNGDATQAVGHIGDILNELDKRKLSIRNYIG